MAPFVEKAIFSLLYCLCSFVKDQLTRIRILSSLVPTATALSSVLTLTWTIKIISYLVSPQTTLSSFASVMT